MDRQRQRQGQRKGLFPAPISQDTDSDGLTDAVEQQFGTDPTKRDTDFDGLSDRTELYGPIEVVLFDGDENELNNPLLILPSYEGPPAIVNAFNATSDTTTTGDDVQEVPFGEAAADGQVVITAGPDNEITTLPNTGPEGIPVEERDDSNAGATIRKTSPIRSILILISDSVFDGLKLFSASIQPGLMLPAFLTATGWPV